MCRHRRVERLQNTNSENSKDPIRFPAQSLLGLGGGFPDDAEVCNGLAVVPDRNGLQPEGISVIPADHVQLDDPLRGDMAETGI